MANLKDLRKRIQVVKSTKKITSAMKLVATSYVKKAEERYHSGQKYKEGFQKAIDILLSNTANSDLEEKNDLITGRKGKNHLIILLSADRGLCGGFNGNIGRYASKRIAQLQKDGKEIQIMCIGKKAMGAIKPAHKSLVVKAMPMPTDQHYHYISMVTEKIIEGFLKKEFDTCEIIYNEFKSILACLPTCLNFMPVQRTENKENKDSPLYDLEPKDDASVDRMIRKYMTAQLYAAVMDSQVSEQSSRMMAMDNASRNAEELINKLELKYNRTRQSMITSELIEIISGAEAL